MLTGICSPARPHDKCVWYSTFVKRKAWMKTGKAEGTQTFVFFPGGALKLT